MTHPNGLFSWADLSSPDVAAGKLFYEELFSWTSEDQHDPAANLIYVLFSKDGDLVSGIGPQPPEMAGSGMPPVWASYVAVDSVDETVATVTANGGTVIMSAMDVMDSGRMAILADPSGAVFSLWQAGTHQGAERFNDPGCMTWNELATRDVGSSKAFYEAVFGWRYEEAEMPTGFTYTTFFLGERFNGGIIPMNEDWPAEMPPHWMVYFRVDDTDDAVLRLKGLGGSISVPPFDSPGGRISVVGDAQGGTFSIIGPMPTPA